MVLGIIIFLLLIVMTQAVQTYYLLLDINVILAYSFLVLGLLLMIYVVIYPTVKFLLLPRAAVLPGKEAYQTDPGKRKMILNYLRENNALKTCLIREDKTIIFDETTTDEEIETALTMLNTEAEKIIRSNASRVFIATTISQNGSLDAIFMLIHMTKMVWQVATLYHQRPGIGKLIKIYINVLATLFLTRSLEDLELLDEQLEPMISLMFGSVLTSLVPGVQTAVNLLLNSAIQGSANAYLLLRVGLIAQEFIINEEAVDKRKIRKSATIKALPMLGSVVNDNRKIIQATVVKLAKKVSKDTYSKSRNWSTSWFMKDEDKSNGNYEPK